MASKTHPLVDGLFSFKGRMRRSEYWLTSFGLGIFKAVLTAILAVATGQLVTKDGGWAGGLVELLFLWPTLAIMVKRGHDRNRPALLSIGILIVCVVMGAIMGFYQYRDAPLLVSACLLGAVGCVGFLLVDYGFIDGTQGPNRYGPSPKGIGPQTSQTNLASVFD